jgi:L-threonylcarbamoyladenylate synthase
VGSIIFGDEIPLSTTWSINLSPSGDLHEAAHYLFAALRAIERWPVQTVAVSKVPDIGIGKAINDRLTRACYK